MLFKDRAEFRRVNPNLGWAEAFYREILERPQHRDRELELLQQGGGLETFEGVIGPVDQVQIEWHNYVRQLKSALSGEELNELKLRKRSEATNSYPGR